MLLTFLKKSKLLSEFKYKDCAISSPSNPFVSLPKPGLKEPNPKTFGLGCQFKAPISLSVPFLTAIKVKSDNFSLQSTLL